MCVLPKYVQKIGITDTEGEIHFKLKFYMHKSLWEKDRDFSSNKKNFFTIPCGFCPECCMAYSSEWQTRIMNEASLYKDNCFITLTYAETNGFLVKRHLQLFLKRLRKKIGSFRYFACGEYGAKKQRPHYHVIIFGWKPPDMVFLKKTSRGSLIYTSQTLSKLWTYGYVSIGEVNEDTAKYSAKYMQKLVEDDLYKPFTTMSLKPGIGYRWFEVKLLNDPEALNRDKIYFKGDFKKIPRYYLRCAERNGVSIDRLRAARLLKQELSYSDEKIDDRLEEYRKKYKFLKK